MYIVPPRVRRIKRMNKTLIIYKSIILISVASILILSHSRTKIETIERDFNRYPKWYENSIAQTVSRTCKNTIQGSIIADDRGYVCENVHIDTETGCCSNHPTVKKYYCARCDVDSKCCSHYEYCVSCCMSAKTELLEESFESHPLQPLLSSNINSTFELCSILCRTSSKSVVHQNAYRSSSLKYCFGKEPPPLKIK